MEIFKMKLRWTVINGNKRLTSESLAWAIEDLDFGIIGYQLWPRLPCLYPVINAFLINAHLDYAFKITILNWLCIPGTI